MPERPPLAYPAALRALADCFADTARLLRQRRLHLPRQRVGMRLRFADGTSARVFRETTVDRGATLDPCVLVVEFRLRAVRGRGHAVFRRESLLNTPLFAGFPGLVSKLWLADDERGRYRGLYEWDGPAYPAEPAHTEPDFPGRDFACGRGWGSAAPSPVGEPFPGVVCLLATSANEPADWVAAGQALQRVLLRAATRGVAAALHSQPLEVPQLRDFIRVQLAARAHPQMIIRLGVTAQAATSIAAPSAMSSCEFAPLLQAGEEVSLVDDFFKIVAAARPSSSARGC